MRTYTQGVDASNVDAVEKLILDKLAELAQSGFSEGAIEAAINTIEFSLRENNTGSFPRGLSLMLRAMGAWIYDRDPYTPIQVGLGFCWLSVRGAGLRSSVTVLAHECATGTPTHPSRYVWGFTVCSLIAWG